MPTFYRKDDGKLCTRGNLPHWSQSWTACFITFRLGDSLPKSVLDKIWIAKEAVAREHPDWGEQQIKEEMARLHHNRKEKYLDAGYGECLLARKDVRDIVAKAIEYYNHEHYHLHNYIIMPNHVHILLDIIPGHSIQDTLASIKKFTANSINKLLDRHGPLWQRESFDRLVRTERHYAHTWKYIRNNAQYCPSGTYTYWQADSE